MLWLGSSRTCSIRVAHLRTKPYNWIEKCYMSVPSATPTGVFPASYDSTTKIVSAIGTIVLIAIAALTQSIAVAGLSALIVLGSYAWSPGRYALVGRAIRVHRLVGDAVFPLDDVREARIAAARDLSGCVRLFGNGGLFGYYGLFRTSMLGKCTWYVTSRDQMVLVVTGSGTALFSPDDAEGFLHCIEATAPFTPVPSRAISPAPRIGSLIGRLLTVAVLLAVAVAVGFAVTYAPGPPAYTLTPDALTIHDRFYPVTLSANNVNLDLVRLLDPAADTDWRRTARTNGFANSHYRSGWFRVSGGKTVRLYQADGRRLVLLPPKGSGTAVLLDTRDPESFLRQLRQTWSRGS